MAQLIVRNIDDDLVRELKLRAARAGVSAEEQHRQILREVLGGNPPRRSLKEHIEQMPDPGDEHFFDRIDGEERSVDL